MKTWEEAELLTSVLDRHAERICTTPASDWTIYWTIPQFFRLIRGEPLLKQVVDDYLEEVDRLVAARVRRCTVIAREAGTLLAKYQAQLDAIKGRIPESQRDSWGIDGLFASVDAIGNAPENHESTQRAVEAIHQWVAFGFDSTRDEWIHPELQDAKVEIGRVRNTLKGLLRRSELAEASHPGFAYLNLQSRFKQLDFVASDDPFADEVHNQSAARVHESIRESHDWGDVGDDLAQPAIRSIQREVRTLHLGLVTALARGRSRWAIVRRFAARCVTFDRSHLLAEIAKGRNGPEAVLTVAFARYLFDGGFNPLVDVSACGLRPDVLDATSEPAVYVEAKQYEAVSDGTATLLLKALHQTVNTWARLAQRWSVPEAFVLVFRRSGRPLEIQPAEVRWRGGRLYVLVVDLAEASESGSRAAEPVVVDLHMLLKVGNPASEPRVVDPGGPCDEAEAVPPREAP